MLIAVTDTETTGILRGDYTSPSAPHLASVGLLLVDVEEMRIVSSLSAMIQPDGWEMPPEASQANGLTTEMLEDLGLPLDHVLPTYMGLLSLADLIVAHNVKFDVGILASALYRSDGLDTLDMLLAKETYCTMEKSKHIVQAKTKNNRLKNPRLEEAYYFFTGEDLENAHTANADTVACLEVYMGIQRWEEEHSKPETEIKL